MLLQTNSYIVPKEKRAEHARLMRRFRQALGKLGCDMFEIYEQVGANWSGNDANGRYVQIMRFRDRKHQVAVQNAERTDPAAQALIAEFCEMVNFPYQQQQGFFAVGYYNSVLPEAVGREAAEAEDSTGDFSAEIAGAAVTGAAEVDAGLGNAAESASASEAIHEMIDGEITGVSSRPIHAEEFESEQKAIVPMEVSDLESPDESESASTTELENFEVEESEHATPLAAVENSEHDSLDLSEYETEEVAEVQTVESAGSPVEQLEFDAEAGELMLAHPNEIVVGGEPSEIIESAETSPAVEPELEEELLEEPLSEDELLGELTSATHQAGTINGTESRVHADPSADTDYGVEHVEEIDGQADLDLESENVDQAVDGTEDSHGAAQPSVETAEPSRERFSLFRRRPRNG